MNYKKNYEEFWKEIVELPDGSLDKEQVMKELSDYSMLIKHLTKIYTLASGNKVSYTTTLPDVVYEFFQEELSDRYDQGYIDAKEEYGWPTE